MRIVISKAASASLQRSNKRVLIAGKIKEFAANPDALAANVIRLQGKPGFRLRVQNWRILFRLVDDEMHIDEIEPRGSIYEDRS